MKSAIRPLLPRSVLQTYRKLLRVGEGLRNRHRPTEDVFTEIYTANTWGGEAGEFCSGGGTADPVIVGRYVETIGQEAARRGFAGGVFVDIGCGDFRVGLQLLPLCGRYIGIDIVKSMIEHNRRQFGGDPKVGFLHMNVIEETPPDGDVCFVRQVLQHLSNAQIAAILGKLDRYRLVYITEHYPSDDPSIQPNLDKVQGPGIRLYDNSGVYLTEPPFSLPERALTLVLEVPGRGVQGDYDAGVIKTFIYEAHKTK